MLAVILAVILAACPVDGASLVWSSVDGETVDDGLVVYELSDSQKVLTWGTPSSESRVTEVCVELESGLVIQPPVSWREYCSCCDPIAKVVIHAVEIRTGILPPPGKDFPRVWLPVVVR